MDTWIIVVFGVGVLALICWAIVSILIIGESNRHIKFLETREIATSDVIKVGGIDRAVRFRYVMCQKLMTEFNRVFRDSQNDPAKNGRIAELKQLYDGQRADLLKLKESGDVTGDEYTAMYKKIGAQEAQMITAVKVQIPDSYFFKAAWAVLEKRGVWPFKKPFRSMRHMIREMEKDEAIGAVKMIGEKILGYQAPPEDSKKKGDMN